MNQQQGSEYASAIGHTNLSGHSCLLSVAL